MNILLVDDEVATLQILRKALPWERLGFQEVFTAYNADGAREILLVNHIDILICDIEMPKESGLDLIRWIQDIYPEIICIILTGYPDFNYARSAISLGVYRYLLKPADFDELEQTIQAAIEKVEEERLGGQKVQQIKSEDITAVAKVKKYLEDHYNDVITRKDVESLVHLNRDYINREFKRVEGYTLMEYIQYYRIVVGKKLLRETEHTIAEIGMEIGYDSPAYFAKIFKKWVGMSPVEYRGKKKDIEC